MEKTNGILKVPEESFVRNKMRKAASVLAGEQKLLPPVKLEKLKDTARLLVKQQAVSEDYLNFAMVLIGNESWRKTMKATPMHRRLLLLPQCLHEKEQCQGMFDELGLNCAGCKACPIDDILIEAEKKGYANLVAEGTTVAVGLVEEGSIDAVIGVSCMPVLQRSFEPVSNAAVPVIGIPLMHDGCENTKADIKWILDEMRSFEADQKYEPISVSLVKSKIQELFTSEKITQYIADEDNTEKIALEYLLIDGQRMRPLLTALSYLAYAEEKNEEIFQRLSLIIECFHKASLIHDDIEDDSNERYQHQTAHKRYGIPQAINVGDYLIGKGYELLSELPTDSSKINRCFKLVAQSHITLTKGQGADILFNSGNLMLETEAMLEVFRNKTGEAIKVALVLGAIAGNASEEDLNTLNQLADNFGIAYQIRDDINEFEEQKADEKTGDFPFLLALLNTSFIQQAKTISPDLSKDVVLFRQQITEEKLDELAKTILQEYTDKCYVKLDNLENARLRLSLYGIMGKIFKPAS